MSAHFDRPKWVLCVGYKFMHVQLLNEEYAKRINIIYTIHTHTRTHTRVSTTTALEYFTQLCTQLKIHIPIGIWIFGIRFHHWAWNAIKYNHQTVFRMFLFVEHIFNDYRLNIMNAFAYARRITICAHSLFLSHTRSRVRAWLFARTLSISYEYNNTSVEMYRNNSILILSTLR